MDLPWRNVAAIGARQITKPPHQNAIVAAVVKDVEKLSVQDGAVAADKHNDSDKNTKIDMTATPTDYNDNIIPDTANTKNCLDNTNTTICSNTKATDTKISVDQDDSAGLMAGAAAPTDKAVKKAWKRKNREGKVKEHFPPN
jgi:hypothetical protein